MPVHYSGEHLVIPKRYATCLVINRTNGSRTDFHLRSKVSEKKSRHIKGSAPNCAPDCLHPVSTAPPLKFLTNFLGTSLWLVELPPQISSPLYLGSGFELNSQALRAIGSGFVLNFPLRNFDLVAPLKLAYGICNFKLFRWWYPKLQSGWWGQRTMGGWGGYGAPQLYLLA